MSDGAEATASPSVDPPNTHAKSSLPECWNPAGPASNKRTAIVRAYGLNEETRIIRHQLSTVP